MQFIMADGLTSRLPIESEVMPMLIIGFMIVMGLALTGVIYFRFKSREHRDPLNWILSHLIFFSIAVFFFIRALNSNLSDPMISESISIDFAIAGLVWAVSMYCLMYGIVKFVTKK